MTYLADGLNNAAFILSPIQLLMLERNQTKNYSQSWWWSRNVERCCKKEEPKNINKNKDCRTPQTSFSCIILQQLQLHKFQPEHATYLADVDLLLLWMMLLLLRLLMVFRRWVSGFSRIPRITGSRRCRHRRRRGTRIVSLRVHNSRNFKNFNLKLFSTQNYFSQTFDDFWRFCRFCRPPLKKISSFNANSNFKKNSIFFLHFFHLFPQNFITFLKIIVTFWNSWGKEQNF